MRAVEIGMTKADFIHQFPEANARGAKAYPQGTVEVLEVMQGTYQFMPSSRTDVVRDWPKNPDKIIEVRVR